MRRTLLYGIALVALAEAQQLYLTTTSYTERPHCTQPAASPEYYFRPFSYTLNETVRYVHHLINAYASVGHIGN